MGDTTDAELSRARAEVLAAADAFVAVAVPALRTALRRRLAALLEREGRRLRDLAEAERAALDARLDAAIEEGVGTVAMALRQEDLWFEPTVFRGDPSAFLSRNPASVDDDPAESVPEHAVDPSPDLDYGYNRVWIAITNGADALDPVLMDAGLPQARTRDIGGGHFGVQPQTSDELDPSRSAEKAWIRYCRAYSRYGQLRRRADG